MYTTFYGLTELPFELSPNPKYLLLTGRHREALANLQYGISAGKSVTLLLGEAGTGKTTLVQAALASDVCQGARIVHLANPMLTRDEFVEFLARAFNLPDEARRSKTTMLAELERELLVRYNNGEKTALVIDEAQCLSRELLEEVRLLSNIETPGRKLMPIVLAGQPEFADRLNLPSLVLPRAAGPGRDVRLRERPAQDCRCQRARDLQSRGSAGRAPAIRRRAEDCQRHLRQRAGQRVCRQPVDHRRESHPRGM
jgi:type II secretory pathway predicted ATPase ExeA